MNGADTEIDDRKHAYERRERFRLAVAETMIDMHPHGCETPYSPQEMAEAIMEDYDATVAAE